MDEWGIHHRVLNAVVETKPGTDCYGIVDVYTDRLEVQGTGDMVSATMHARLLDGMMYDCCSQSTVEQQTGDAASEDFQIVRQTG